MTVEAVVFDVGETLIDETRAWSAWADWLGVPRLTLFGILGGAIARGEDHRVPFEVLRPGLDLRTAAAAREAAGEAIDFAVEDLYPDAVPCLRALRDAGYRLGIAGNQPARTEALLNTLDVDVELVVSSASLGVQKPDPRFFEMIAQRLALPPAAVAYVGDRVDNDVEPAAAAGMVTIFVRRGPWAWIQAGREDPPAADLVVADLAAVPAALGARRPR